MSRDGRKTGGGSRKGRPNVAPTIRAAFEGAFQALQQPDSDKALVVWAEANPTEFYKLAVRLIPQKIEADLNVAMRPDLSTLTEDELATLSAITAKLAGS